MYTLIDDRSIMGKEFRACVVETLQELMKIDDKVVALEADLGGASGFTKNKKTNPREIIIVVMIIFFIVYCNLIIVYFDLM